MSAFAQWQPHYAAHGIATYPVSTESKCPAIKGWQRVGIRGSEQLAGKYADASAFGFQCGPRSGITVVDVDSTDEIILKDAIQKYGRSPVLWRTRSGNFAMPFRHRGEGRSVRPDADLPIDVLGAGHVVAPPSIVAKGEYQFVEGSLDDFDDLPGLKIELSLAEHNSSDDEWLRSKIGRRNSDMWRFAMLQALHVDSFDDLLDVVRMRNMDELDAPLDYQEVVRLTASAWRYETSGVNWIGRKAHIVPIPADALDALVDHPRALALYSILRKHHNDKREFILASQMSESLGWDIKTWRRARNVLIDLGLIVCVHEGGGRPNDPPSYAWKSMRGISHPQY